MKLTQTISSIHHFFRPHVISSKQMATITLDEVILQKAGRNHVSGKTLKKLDTIFNDMFRIPYKAGSDIRYQPKDFAPLTSDDRFVPLLFADGSLSQAFTALSNAGMGYKANASLLAKLYVYQAQAAAARNCWQEEYDQHSDFSIEDASSQPPAAQLARRWLGPMLGQPSASLSKVIPQRVASTDNPPAATAPALNPTTMTLHQAITLLANSGRVTASDLEAIDQIFLRMYGLPIKEMPGSDYILEDFGRTSDAGARLPLLYARETLMSLRHTLRAGDEDGVQAPLSAKVDQLSHCVDMARQYWIQTYWTHFDPDVRPFYQGSTVELAMAWLGDRPGEDTKPTMPVEPAPTRPRALPDSTVEANDDDDEASRQFNAYLERRLDAVLTTDGPRSVETG
jgi:hypothetical protein